MKLKGNNLIIVNILTTYVRILLVVGMGLFSARWVLRALGKEDFGLYSVVGGLIIFIMFIGSTMSGSVQRFYAYSIGQGDNEEVTRWFNTAFVLHAGFALILVLIGVPAGNYLLDYVMKIPPDRLATCHWVYYFSIIGAVGTLFTTPYLAMFYAKQRIFELSFWQVLQTSLTFCLALYLLHASGNLLFIYALGMVGIKLILDLIQIVRAYFLFNFCRIRKEYCFDKQRSIQLTSFAGWNLFGDFGVVARNQGVAFLINRFSLPAVNAAFGLANQVASHTRFFSTAIYQAVAPEITSREGAGSRDRMITLALRACKFSTLLTWLWIVPLFFEMDYVLTLWLKDVPDYTSIFCKIILIDFLINNSSTGYSAAVKACGKIRGYQFTLGGLRILTFPLAWVAFACGMPPEVALSSIIITGIGAAFGRIFWVKKLMQVPYLLWVKSVLFRCILIVLPTVVVAYLLDNILEMSFLRLVIITGVTICCTLLTSWIYGLDHSEKDFVRGHIEKFKNRILLSKN